MRNFIPIIAAIGALALVSVPAHAAVTAHHAPVNSHRTFHAVVKNRIHGEHASWYGLNDGSGRVTASGRPFNPYALGVAHKSLPFGTRIRFTVPATGASVVATVLDRTGPAVAAHGRTWDLYYGTARQLGVTHQGDVLVQSERLSDPEEGSDGREGCGAWVHSRSRHPVAARSAAHRPHVTALRHRRARYAV